MNKLEWIQTFIGGFWYLLSFGFFKVWPYYFDSLETYLQNSTYNETKMTFPIKTHVTRTGLILAIAIPLGAGLSGALIPKLGNRLVGILFTFIMGLMLLVFSYLVQYGWISLLLLPFIPFGFAGGVLNVNLQNNIVKSVSKENKGTSLVLCSIGLSVAFFTLPKLFRITTEKCGLLRSLRITSCLFFIGTFLSFFTSSKKQEFKEKPKLISKTLFKNKNYTYFLVVAVAAYVSNSIFSVFFVDYLQSSMEMSHLQIQRVFITMALGDLLSRVVGSFAFRKYDTIKLLRLFLAMNFIMTVVLFLATIDFQIVLVVPYIGISVGMIAGCLSVLLSKIVPVKEHAIASAYFMLLVGFSNIPVTVFCNVMVQITGNVNLTNLVVAFLVAISIFFLKKIDLNENEENVEKQQLEENA